MQLFLYRKSRNALLGSSSDASVPDFKLRRSEKIPSSNFLEFLTGRPKAWNLKDRHRTMSVPEMWKRLFLQDGQLGHSACAMGRSYHKTQETYSPVGRRNLRIYWSGCQSTGAEIRKYLTVPRLAYSSEHWRRMRRCRSNSTSVTGAEHTVINLLQGDDAVRRQALLCVLVQEEGLRRDGASLRWGHLGGGKHAALQHVPL